MVSVRLINPSVETLIDAVRGAQLLANVQVPSSRKIGMNDGDRVALAKGIDAKPAGFWHTDGGVAAFEGDPRGNVSAAVSVAWFTRLNGQKVVRATAEAVKVGSAGQVDAPSLVAAKYAEPILIAEGYPVLVSERLAAAFAKIAGVEKHSKTPPPPCFTDVLADPGDLSQWAGLADWADVRGATLFAADIRKAIGV